MAAFDEQRQAEIASACSEFPGAAELFQALKGDEAGKEEWFAHQIARTELDTRGLGPVVDFCADHRLSAEQVPEVIERAVLEAWCEHHLLHDAALSPSRSADRDSVVEEFRELDRQLMSSAAARIVAACDSRRPLSTSTGEGAIIQREALKQKKHMPVKTLLERTATVTQAIKPCFMMSPLAVSQFLPPKMTFDVVIFDEASQVTPADAINCIYRGAALIMAGDPKQLPPTRFFAAGTEDTGDEWTSDADDAGDFRSILDLMKGTGAFQSLTLRWHYRSRHEALIAFSNHAFYQSKLVTFPGPDESGPDVGVEMFAVNGVYRRGTSRDNPVEAAEVARRVIHHLSTRPEYTLGVVTMSEDQSRAVENAVEEALKDRPELRERITDDRLTGYFVKNLESVQGDERDVMIFSLGYGPDENGKTFMNFGPINKEGGWRRLNVAITRARYRNEIVTSLRAGDIRTTDKSEGLRHLRHYLDYAERGIAALALDTGVNGDAESPFEESVISVIRSWGYDVTPQVGSAGYRIDIGIRHPDRPNVFVLGVECDGYQYHSSRAARDRDRLRDKVLRDLGWRLHRIWSTAWYRDRTNEELRLRTAIESALAAPVRGLLTVPAEKTEAPALAAIATSVTAKPDWTRPYEVAEVIRLPGTVDTSDITNADALVDTIAQIAALEAPLHVTTLDQRVRQALGVARIGQRLRAFIDRAVNLAGLESDGDFVVRPGTAIGAARTPSDALARRIEHVHDSELAFLHCCAPSRTTTAS